MNLFEKAKKLSDLKELCLNCHQPYQPDKRNVSRGWGLFCSKSCSVTWRNVYQHASSQSDRIIMERERKLKQLGI